MKFIVAQLLPDGNQYRDSMRVVRSNHPRFVDDSRFDYGFMGIALCEGYTITVLPSEGSLDPKWKDGDLVEETES